MTSWGISEIRSALSSASLALVVVLIVRIIVLFCRIQWTRMRRKPAQGLR
jgi:hypothetical protein